VDDLAQPASKIFGPDPTLVATLYVFGLVFDVRYKVQVRMSGCLELPSGSFVQSEVLTVS